MKKSLVLIPSLLTGLTLSNTSFAESNTNVETANPYQIRSSNGKTIESIPDSKNFNPQEFKGYQGTGSIESSSKIQETQEELQKLNKELNVPQSFKLDEPNNIVIGTDTRREVVNTRVFPFSAITYLHLMFPIGRGSCTGTLISNNYVLTNAHCLYDRPSNAEVKGIHVFPRLGGPNSTPYSHTTNRSVFHVNSRF